MHEWTVTLTQPDADGVVRLTTAVVTALDAFDAVRRAQRVLAGWTAVLAVKS